LTIFLVETRTATGYEIADHIVRLGKVIPPCCVTAGYTQMIIIIERYQKVLNRVVEWRERRMMSMRIVRVLM